MREFLFRPLLEELTAVTNEQTLDPFDAWAWLFERQLAYQLRPETYCSTAITTGGHSRNPGLKMQTIIARNIKNSLQFAEELARLRQIDPSSTIEPAAVHKTHFSQGQYLELWLSVIAQVDVKQVPTDVFRNAVQAAYWRHGVDWELLNANASADKRAPEYFKQATAFAEVVENLPRRSISRIVRLIDTEQSLGAQAEAYFAKLLGIPVMRAVAMKPVDSLKEGLGAIAHPELRLDTAKLVSYGATIFSVAEKKQLVLVPETTAALTA